MFFSEATIHQLYLRLGTVAERYNAIGTAFAFRQYRTARGKEYATHGFARRFGTLKRCIQQVFRLLPPDRPGIPEEDDLHDATIALQAFVFNVFGCIDNLAWVWVEERGITKPDGTPLPRSAIGLSNKCQTVRASLSANYRQVLEQREDWFAALEGYRHALAHRIPIYIPPHSIEERNEAEYIQLAREIHEAGGNDARREELERRRRSLMYFQPVMRHSYTEDDRSVIFHPQILSDFGTIEELARMMLTELDNP